MIISNTERVNVTCNNIIREPEDDHKWRNYIGDSNPNHSNYEENKGMMIMIIYQISDLFEVLNLNYKSKKRVC